jgi:hypothetical protein
VHVNNPHFFEATTSSSLSTSSLSKSPVMTVEVVQDDFSGDSRLLRVDLDFQESILR